MKNGKLKKAPQDYVGIYMPTEDKMRLAQAAENCRLSISDVARMAIDLGLSAVLLRFAMIGSNRSNESQPEVLCNPSGKPGQSVAQGNGPIPSRRCPKKAKKI